MRVRHGLKRARLQNLKETGRARFPAGRAAPKAPQALRALPLLGGFIERRYRMPKPVRPLGSNRHRARTPR
jgi:hypothetical protein